MRLPGAGLAARSALWSVIALSVIASEGSGVPQGLPQGPASVLDLASRTGAPDGPEARSSRRAYTIGAGP
ncbi:MAG: hypothetical protein COT56_08300 [Methylobacterium sp. CG09_land_8_20_14_0_10_71_15]|nr:MAG: hypothetical protein COT56_08300 [Methylobacterium sp. CG09_land_8_20_14_0_10_71_15]GBU19957.1 hypothetical protein AwMethylo_41720 [Methylobacterium sp.]